LIIAIGGFFLYRKLKKVPEPKINPTIPTEKYHLEPEYEGVCDTARSPELKSSRALNSKYKKGTADNVFSMNLDSMKVENVDAHEAQLKEIDNEKFQSSQMGPSNTMFQSRSSFRDQDNLAESQNDKDIEVENVKEMKNIFGKRKHKGTFK